MMMRIGPVVVVVAFLVATIVCFNEASTTPFFNSVESPLPDPCEEADVIANAIITTFGARVSWSLNCSSKTISVLYEAPTTGWVGVGWNTQDDMPYADICFAWVSNEGKSFIYDAQNGYYAAPSVDDVDNLIDGVITENATYTVVQFTKLLNTSDTEDIVISPQATLYLVAAMSLSDPANNNYSQAGPHIDAQGQYSLMQVISINFYSNDTSSSTTSSSTSSSSTSGGTTTGSATTGGSPGCPAGEVYTGQGLTPFGAEYSWLVDCTAGTITFTYEAPTLGWAAVGWNKEEDMPGADIAFGWVNDTGTSFIYDATNGAYSPPIPDTQDDLTSTTVLQNDTYTTIIFTKKLNTNDPEDIPIAQSTTLYFLAAMALTDPAGDDIEKAAAHFTPNGGPLMEVIPVNFFPSGGSTTTTTTTGSTTGSTVPTNCPPGQFFRGSYTNAESTWSINWVINCTGQFFSGLITAKATGWVGFGINTAAQMPGADVLQASCDPSSQSVTYIDAYTVAYIAPIQDTQNNLFSVNCTEVNGQTTIGFSRMLNTGDPQDKPFINGNQFMLWSFNDDDDNFGTKHTDKAVLQINFFTGATTMGIDLKLVHGILMIIAWALISPIATFIAVYLKGLGHLWFQLHAALQVIGLVIMFTAFVIIESYLGPMSRAHFQNAHNDIGLIIVILTFVQVFLGYLANKMYSPERTKTPFFPDKLHWFVGRFLFLFVIVNIFLGFDQYGFTTTRVGTFVTYAVWVFVLFILIGFMWWRSRSVDISDSNYNHQKVPLIALGIYGLLAIVFFSIIASLMFQN
jgi:hypothetical protein